MCHARCHGWHAYATCLGAAPNTFGWINVGISTLRWRHNDHAGVSNHQPHGCLLNRLFRRKSKKTSKLRVTGLCAGNSPGTGEFPAQMASYAENVSIWWRHHELFAFSHRSNDYYQKTTGSLFYVLSYIRFDNTYSVFHKRWTQYIVLCFGLLLVSRGSIWFIYPSFSCPSLLLNCQWGNRMHKGEAIYISLIDF